MKTAWLIEREQREWKGASRYMTVRGTCYTWTTDVDQAIKYFDAESANRVLTTLPRSDVFVAEHGFID